ncbi:hypothetical protein ACLRDC_08790 [Gluconacetobacter sacchari]|uniref:Beta-barrel assembly machine subunit BamF n=1 Tax=Gluconacetobacter sacchari DSM 12717 TaxID=1307940 RepID=A0ABQ0PC25_9PROT|nr:hypothetical protein [Gluconacetobacter sacchari]GBQ31168.1 hypothetical protein AA12717_3676 [Gluconacetobacter sacchari DSM 12717]
MPNPSDRRGARGRLPGAYVPGLLVLLAGLAACAPKRPEGDSIDVPPLTLFSGQERPGAAKTASAGQAGRDGSQPMSAAPAGRQPDYQPLPDAFGMQMIASGFDANAAGDDGQKEDAEHYVIPDTQVSYGARNRGQTTYGR